MKLAGIILIIGFCSLSQALDTVNAVVLQRPLLLEKSKNALESSIFVEFGKPGVASQNIFKDGCTVSYTVFKTKGAKTVLPRGTIIPIQTDQRMVNSGWQHVERRQMSMISVDDQGKPSLSFSINCRSSNALRRMEPNEISDHLTGIVRLVSANGEASHSKVGARRGFN